MAFAASRHIPGKVVEATYNAMDAFVEAGIQYSGDRSQKLAKLVKLAMQGRWNTRYI